MSALYPQIDPDGLLEYSVVFTDRSLNHMSQRFQDVMRELSDALKEVYHADATVLVPGGGTYAMESVARQLAGGERALVIRNGYFSYRWTQILEMGGFCPEHRALKARRVDEGPRAPFAPVPIEEARAEIDTLKPAVVFAPHVETSAGMLLPDDYIRALADAVHAVGGLLVLDCVASGALWVDMAALGVDVLISAPQKGWTSSPCAGVVMLREAALERVKARTSSSFAIDLKRWLEIMNAYEGGGHAYHATLPTDALTQFRDALAETRTFGFEAARRAQQELGTRVRQLVGQFGFASVAAPGFEAPGVVVSYTDDADIKSGSRFAASGLQVAAGVPLMCDEGDDYSSFRIGLFGLDKLKHVDRTVDKLQQALLQVCG